MKIESPIPEGKVPIKKSIPPARYMELYDAVMKLPGGSVLPVLFETPKEASRVNATLTHSKYAQFKVTQREAMLYVRLRNEDDEKQAQHVKRLREQARAKKAAVAAPLPK